MRAAVIRELGAVAEMGEVPEPGGETIEVLAAPINPIDVAVSRGVLAIGHPELHTCRDARQSVVLLTVASCGSSAERSGEHLRAQSRNGLR